MLIFGLTLFDMYRGGLCTFDHSICLSEMSGNLIFLINKKTGSFLMTKKGLRKFEI